MQIVEQTKIPKLSDIVDVPLTNPALIYKTCQQMVDVCQSNTGIGLSAVQVGIPWRLFVMKSVGCPLIPKNEWGFFVNCEYAPRTDEQVISLEGCLSLQSSEGEVRIFEVKRYTKIIVRGLMMKSLDQFVPIEEDVLFSEQGVVFQHEIDHHRGVLISDIGQEIFVW